MIGVILFFGMLVAAGTLVDIVVNILHLEEVFSEKSIQMLQGFSLYSNTIKLFHCPETGKDGSLDCIHGIRSSMTFGSVAQENNMIRFISMTWVVVGHGYSQFAGQIFSSNWLVSQTTIFTGAINGMRCLQYRLCIPIKQEQLPK